MPKTPAQELASRLVAAASASTISAIIVTPLDVIKTRMQVAAVPTVSSSYSTMRVLACFGEDWTKPCYSAYPWLASTMPLYDHLHAQLKRDAGIYAPALAGMAARAVAVSATAPLELLRTRQQASHSNSSGHSWSSLVGAQQPCSSSSRSFFNTRQLKSMLPRVKGMWTGLGATLARDVPFTALYWCNVEPIRHRLLPPGADAPTTSQVFWANLTAGSVSGALAAAATTPFDVVKTRLQTAGTHGQLPRGIPGRHLAQPARCMALNQLSTLGMLRSIWYTEGVHGLFTGVGPRVARAAPACAIVISSYEVIKKVL